MFKDILPMSGASWGDCIRNELTSLREIKSAGTRLHISRPMGNLTSSSHAPHCAECTVPSRTPQNKTPECGKQARASA